MFLPLDAAKLLQLFCILKGFNLEGSHEMSIKVEKFHRFSQKCYLCSGFLKCRKLSK